MRRFLPRGAPIGWLMTGLVTLVAGCGINPVADTYEGPPAVSSSTSPARPAAAPSHADVQAAVQRIIEAGRHPLLKWPDISDCVPALAAAAAGERDGLFWFVDGVGHSSLDGTLAALAQRGGTWARPGRLRCPVPCRPLARFAAHRGPAARDLAAFDTALSVAVVRFLSSVHAGRVEPRLVGFDYDVSAKRLDAMVSLQSARDEFGGLSTADRVGQAAVPHLLPPHERARQVPRPCLGGRTP